MQASHLTACTLNHAQAMTKLEWEKNQPPKSEAAAVQPKPRRGPFTRFPEEAGCAYGEQIWFKP